MLPGARGILTQFRTATYRAYSMRINRDENMNCAGEGIHSDGDMQRNVPSFGFAWCACGLPLITRGASAAPERTILRAKRRERRQEADVDSTRRGVAWRTTRRTYVRVDRYGRAERTVDPLKDDALEEADQQHRKAADARVDEVEHVDAALCRTCTSRYRTVTVADSSTSLRCS